jgi:hypothetical protein
MAGCSKRSFKNGCCAVHYPLYLAQYRQRRADAKLAADFRPKWEYNGDEKALVDMTEKQAGA